MGQAPVCRHSLSLDDGCRVNAGPVHL